MEYREMRFWGAVQGVGFRPHLCRLGRELGLVGGVWNAGGEAYARLGGDSALLEEFGRRAVCEAPRLCRVAGVENRGIEAFAADGFEIWESAGGSGWPPLPDAGICDACVGELWGDGRRRNYPFIACADCGPRQSMAASLPYDRENTAMRDFPLCPECAAEFEDMGDRRFHAQPLACHECGPSLKLVWLEDGKIAEFAGKGIPGRLFAPLQVQMLASCLYEGGVLAIKGVGGYHLVCDAWNLRAVERIRAFKDRPFKPLALMGSHLDYPLAGAWPGPAMPIVIGDCGFEIEGIAPGLGKLGIMRPYTALHHMLLWEFGRLRHKPLLVMTSANLKDMPLAAANEDGRLFLGNPADIVAEHDREILSPIDDSIVEAGRVLRLGRGLAPHVFFLKRPARAPGWVLGMGAELKSAFCFLKDERAILGPHMGDLKEAAALEAYERALGRLMEFMGAKPAIIARDAHPDYWSGRLAADLAARLGARLADVQHHVAHAAAVLAEAGHFQPALAICLDGMGYGPNGEIWGGEILELALGGSWRRLASLRPFPLPGGDLAARWPCRIAQGLAAQAGIAGPLEGAEAGAINQMLAAGLNCPKASSAGRLFEAMAAGLGLCGQATYEGEAGARLQARAEAFIKANGPVSDPLEIIPANWLAGPLPRLDAAAMYAAAMAALQKGMEPDRIAAAFHQAMAAAFARKAAELAGPIRHVALCGGCFQNSLLAGLLAQALKAEGLIPIQNKFAPVNDGGIALGQAAWAGFM